MSPLRCVLVLVIAGTTVACAGDLEDENQKLASENAQLREEMRSQQELAGSFASRLNEIVASIQEMEEDEEAMTVTLGGDFGPAQFQKATRELDAMTAKLASTRQQSVELRAALAASNQSLRQLEGTVAGLEELLAGRERDLETLRSRLDQVLRENRELRAATARLTVSNQHLQQDVVEERSQREEVEQRAGELEKAVDSYLLVAPDTVFGRLRDGGLLRRRVMTLEVAPEALTSGAFREQFQRVSGAQRELLLHPQQRGAKMRSVHRKYSDLFRIERRDGGTYLVLREPAAFWRISRQAIVEIE